MEKKKPLRKCIGCNEMKEKSALIRIIRTAEGNILLDKTGRMNGRGAYVCPKDACLEMAVKNGGLSRSFKMKTDPSILELLRKEFGEHASS